MNPYIDADLQALGEQARRFATGRVAPGFLERDTTRVLDRQLMHEMGEMGFIAPELPEEFGGQGMGCLAAGVIHEEIARADLSISYINLLASLNGQILAQHGPPHVAKPWLQKLTDWSASRHRSGPSHDRCREHVKETQADAASKLVDRRNVRTGGVAAAETGAECPT